ncbi:DUF3545 family protein [Thalassotalea sp. PLHSN55]|uniref:DUF3545 family protein n=1 Tax=Thalassotalea sp. PLHSN55 TaxID=3435888 RepID=UPI003F8616E7
MDKLQQVLSPSNKTAKTSGSNKKRKWREIEQLKDQYQLEKDLKVFEDSLEHMLDEF